MRPANGRLRIKVHLLMLRSILRWDRSNALQPNLSQPAHQDARTRTRHWLPRSRFLSRTYSSSSLQIGLIVFPRPSHFDGQENKNTSSAHHAASFTRTNVIRFIFYPA